MQRAGSVVPEAVGAAESPARGNHGYVPSGRDRMGVPLTHLASRCLCQSGPPPHLGDPGRTAAPPAVAGRAPQGCSQRGLGAQGDGGSSPPPLQPSPGLAQLPVECHCSSHHTPPCPPGGPVGPVLPRSHKGRRAQPRDTPSRRVRGPRHCLAALEWGAVLGTRAFLGCNLHSPLPQPSSRSPPPLKAGALAGLCPPTPGTSREAVTRHLLCSVEAPGLGSRGRHRGRRSGPGGQGELFWLEGTLLVCKMAQKVHAWTWTRGEESRGGGEPEFRSQVPRPGTLSGRPVPGWGVAPPWPHGSSPPLGSWYPGLHGLLVPCSCPQTAPPAAGLQTIPSRTSSGSLWFGRHSLVPGPLASPTQPWLPASLPCSTPHPPNSLLWRLGEEWPPALCTSFMPTPPPGTRPSALCPCCSLHPL